LLVVGAGGARERRRAEPDREGDGGGIGAGGEEHAVLDAERAGALGRPAQEHVREDAHVLAPLSPRELSSQELVERRPEQLRGVEESGEVFEGDDFEVLGVGWQAMVRRRERQLGEADGRSGRQRAPEAGHVARRADDGDVETAMAAATTLPEALEALGQVEERDEVALRQEREEQEVAVAAGAAAAVLLLVTHCNKNKLIAREWNGLLVDAGVFCEAAADGVTRNRHARAPDACAVWRLRVFSYGFFRLEALAFVRSAWQQNG